MTLIQVSNLLFLVSIALWSGGCQSSDGSPSSSEIPPRGTLSFEEIDVPTGSESSTPSLHSTAEGEVLVSWVETRMGGGHALRFARLQDGEWADPKTIAEGENWFANWADFPALISLGGDTLAAHFLARNGKGTYSYDVLVTQSIDGGETWSSPIRPYTDSTKTEHGFVSMLRTEDGTLFATWLDGRNTRQSNGAMTLRAATLDSDGRLSQEALLDDRTCDCCQTSSARTENGFVVAYRDRTNEEIRDIYVVRMRDGAWSEPETVHRDGWQINGCPVNGPSVAAKGEFVAIAWFTGAGGTQKLNLSFSSDEGHSFWSPIRIDDGRPAGRVHTVLLSDSSVVVSWMERVESGAEIRVRRIRPDGTFEESSTVASVTGSRTNGFPRMTLNGYRLYIAWTEAGDSTSIRTAVAILDS
ncbi:MAG: sialidase family protein [Rhodothermia bacterium]